MINEARLEKALSYLASTDEPCAELKADVGRSEYKAKSQKATAFLHYEGTVAEREASALTNEVVRKSYDEHFKAIRDYQAMANKRSLEVLVVDVWRSMNANRRTGNV